MGKHLNLKCDKCGRALKSPDQVFKGLLCAMCWLDWLAEKSMKVYH